MLRCLLAVAICLVVSSVSAQEEIPFPKPSEGHKFLKKFVGEWETQTSCKMTPDSAPIPCTGKISGKMLGRFWVICTHEGNMSGMTYTASQTIGYDSKKKKYVATWADSMTDYMWKYNGQTKGEKLVFHAEGPHYLKPGETMKFRDTYEFVSETEMKLKSEGQLDGKWTTFMTGKATRKKK